MDIRQIDEVDEQVSLDLLREWTANTSRREVREVFPLGDAWTSLVAALQHAGFSANGFASAGGSATVPPAGSPADIEKEVRRRLVLAYLSQSEEVVNAIIDAKLVRNAPFARTLGPDLARAKQGWSWYLCCLTICMCEPLEPGFARMLVDEVDLWAIANCLQVGFYVSQLLAPELRVQPAKGEVRANAHLIHHRGLWAPVLGRRPPEREARHLVQSIVELRRSVLNACPGATGRLLEGGGVAALVVQHDEKEDLYLVDLGEQRILVERSHIARQLYHPSMGSRVDAARGGGGGGGGGLVAGGGPPGAARAAEAAGAGSDILAGIPPNSLEWSVLHELVRRKARSKLEEMMRRLSGREADGPPRPKHTSVNEKVLETHAEEEEGQKKEEEVQREERAAEAGPPRSEERGAAPAPLFAAAAVEDPVDEIGWPLSRDSLRDLGGAPARGFSEAPPVVTERLPFRDVKELVVCGSELSVFSVLPFDAAAAGAVSLAVGDEVRICEVHNEWVYVVHQHPRKRRCSISEGWCPRDCVSVWEAHRPFLPGGSHPRDNISQGGNYLALEKGDAIVISERYEGEMEGLGFGVRWGTKKGSGIFLISCTEPFALVRRHAFHL